MCVCTVDILMTSSLSEYQTIDQMSEDMLGSQLSVTNSNILIITSL